MSPKREKSPELPPLEQCREQALRLLEMRAHGTAELRRKLYARRKFSADDIRQVIADLLATGLLNDDEFARQLCESLKSAGPGGAGIGRRLAQLKLRQRGLSQECVDRALASFWDANADSPAGDTPRGESARALLAARTKWRALARSNDDPAKKREKLARFLASRGFQPDDIYAILNRREFRDPS